MVYVAWQTYRRINRRSKRRGKVVKIKEEKEEKFLM